MSLEAGISTPREAPPGRVLLAFAAIYVIWGSTYLAIRFAVETIPPFLMAGIRFGVAGGILYLGLRSRGVPGPRRVEWKAAFWSGGLMLLGGNGLLSWSEQYVPSGLAALLVGTVPLWMVALAWLGPDRDRPGRWELVGLATGFAGVALLVSPSAEVVGSLGAEPRRFLLGTVAVLVASLSWAIGSLYNRRAILPARPLFATAMTMVAGGLLLVLTGIARGEIGMLSLGAVSARSAWALAYLIVFGSVIAFSAYTWLLRVVRPALVGTYAYVNPIVAVLLGWWLASEPVTGRMALAMTVIIGSVALVERGRRRGRTVGGGARDAPITPPPASSGPTLSAPVEGRPTPLPDR